MRCLLAVRVGAGCGGGGGGGGAREAGLGGGVAGHGLAAGSVCRGREGGRQGSAGALDGPGGTELGGGWFARRQHPWGGGLGATGQLAPRQSLTAMQSRTFHAPGFALIGRIVGVDQLTVQLAGDAGIGARGQLGLPRCKKTECELQEDRV